MEQNAAIVCGLLGAAAGLTALPAGMVARVLSCDTV